MSGPVGSRSPPRLEILVPDATEPESWISEAI